MQLSLMLFIQFIIFVLLFEAASTSAQTQTQTQSQPQPSSDESTNAKSQQPPQPIQTASYVSLDGLTLVVIFDKPVNLSSYIESVELRLQNEAHSEKEHEHEEEAAGSSGQLLQVRTEHPHFEAQTMAISENSEQLCAEMQPLAGSGQETQELVHGIQLCARLLTKKTLKLLHKYHLYDCVWPSRVQFLVQLGKPLAHTGPIKISFQRQSIGEFNQDAEVEPPRNEREISLDLNRLPLESLGVPLSPRLAITGPNQVPSCGQFVLSAHLSSPFGTQPEEGVKLSWSVERIGFSHPGSSHPGNQQHNQPPMMLFNGSQLSPAVRVNQINADSQGSEARWRQLQQLVSSTRANSLVLDSQLLQYSPQIYDFRLSAQFSTSLTSVSLNASHQVSRLDFETPVGAIYGSHILAQQPQLNTNQELLLLADIQVPDCAQSIKQVGLYWQVSDSRVRFEQTYAPYYLARPNTLPEQSQVEFRVNLFYGIRVKKYSSSSALVSTGHSMLDAQISGGTLVLNIGQESPSGQLELFGAGDIASDYRRQHQQQQQQQQQQQHQQQQQQQELQQTDKYTYQWSCFDGKTAQPCFRSTKATASNGSSLTGSDGGGPLAAVALDVPDAGREPRPQAQPASGLPLVDRQQQRQTNLRLPLGWLDPEAQLWFGLQRFDRLSQSQSQQSQTEYALVELQPGHSASLSIGPVLVGSARQHRATLRNPLTGAILLLANSPAVVVGRLSPAQEIRSFVWHSPNYMGQLHWTWRNVTNPISGQEEILTELHLNPRHQVAYAHSQIQLIACTRLGSQQLAQNELMRASLNLDTVPSVSQCRVRASLVSQSSLAVSFEHCNIPLGLSPITYQVYLVDSSGVDGFVAESNQAAAGASSAAAAAAGTATTSAHEDEHTNEADVGFFETRAQPLTMPQLSPVFLLNGLSPLSLAALLAESAQNGSSGAGTVRFGGRVCDRLQTCRTFYSPPVGLKRLLADWQLRGSSNQSQPLALDLAQQQQQQPFGRQQAGSLLHSLQGMIDSSRRANMAGNSIGAISILNAAMTLGQRLLDGDTVGQAEGAKAESGAQQQQQQQQQQASSSRLMVSFRDRVRDLLQSSMRDSLHYGTVSLQRPFHYTDSGQANLVLSGLARILSMAQSNIELKFRALRLVAQLARRTILEQLSLGSSCLADMQTIQRAFESIFGTFTHYAIDTSELGAEPAASGSAPDTAQLPGGGGGGHAPQQQHWANHSAPSESGRRKRGQEAALAYLKSVRLAYRSLLAAAAVQLPLGEARQFRYSAAPVQLAVAGSSPPLAQSIQKPVSEQAHRSDHPRSAEATPTTTTSLAAAAAAAKTSTSHDINGARVGVNNQESGKLPRTAPLISSDILSSLIHLTSSSDLLTLPAAATTSDANKSIDFNFSQLASISITFDQRFLQRLATLLKEASLLCRNDTGAPGKSASTPAAGSATITPPSTITTPALTSNAASIGNSLGQSSHNCSTFVLALTSFAGKAPFRSLDEGQALRVPHVEVSLLSPLDGSDLIDLQPQLLADDDFKTEVTFTLPNLDGDKPSAQQDSNHPASNLATRRRYKCYQFDEDTNEWLRVAQGERNEIDPQEKRIRCVFNRLGVFAAFQGKPPSEEAPLKSPVVIGLLAVIALIGVISASLCCCSASSNSSEASRSTGTSNSSDDGEHKRVTRRHPEQTHRSDFDYPRPAGG